MHESAETAIEEPIHSAETTPPVDEHHAVVEPEAAHVAGQPWLTVKRAGAETEDVFHFAAPAVIGRFDASVGPVDIDLGSIPEGSYVSRKHAKITHEEGGYKLHDLGSSNGTYILRDSDFQKVDEVFLLDGDEIALGNARFVFHEA